ncbi:MAG: MOSC domain-containing protein [Pirellulales bacterium]|nr:MOSC domain-containing protein [Pirellulales bacterium]
MSSTPSIISIQVGRPRDYGRMGVSDPHDKPWTTGFYKESVTGPVAVDWCNLAGDGQADLENHGGRDKAICAYAAEHYPEWRRDLSLDEFPYGAFGENLTIAGLVESHVCIGDEYATGTALVQVSQPRQPCWKLARRWRIKELTARVIANGKTGWYFRVLRPGIIATGDDLRLTARPRPDWSIARANHVLYVERKSESLSRELASVPELSASWREMLESRANLLA